MDTSPEFLEDFFIRFGKASNPAISGEELEKLGRDRCFSIRGQVAKNPSACCTILERLSRDDFGGIRDSALHNINNFRIREMVKMCKWNSLNIPYKRIVRLDSWHWRGWEIELFEIGRGI